ncbi:MAG: hypothetical protein ABSD39_13155 [Terriglobales bacterium]|jgi:hypothetical protein
MRRIGIFAVSLFLSAACFGASTTDASLKGVYTIQLSSAHFNSWSASLACPDNQTVTFGGNNVNNQSVQGVMTLDGKGNITAGSYTQYGQFDQALSNATVQPSCTPGQGSNGYAVYDPPTTGTLTGTYTVEANGAGTMTLDPSTNNGPVPGFYIQLSGTAAVKTTIFMVEVDGKSDDQPNREEISGMAVLQ